MTFDWKNCKVNGRDSSKIDLAEMSPSFTGLGEKDLMVVWSMPKENVLAAADKNVYNIGIASSNQVQRQQQRDEPVRENTHLVLDTLASRLRSYHLIVGVKSLVFWVIRTQLIYIQSIVCTSG